MEIEKQIDRIIITKGKFYWGLICAIVGACVAVGVPFFSIKQDVALIKENHYIHIENIDRELQELKEADLRLTEENKKLMDRIIEYNSKIDRLMGFVGIKQ